MGPPAAAYSHCVEVKSGRTVYFSGQVALNEGGELVGAGDMAAQTRQIMENVKAGLEALGGDLNCIVKRNIYLADMSRLPDVREGAAGYFSSENPPASTAVEVSKLFRDEYLIEIDFVAVIPE